MGKRKSRNGKRLVTLPFHFDFKNPDYTAVFEYRVERLRRLRANSKGLSAIKLFYKENPIQFINDWGVTYDPRNPELKRPSLIPFILYPRQEEWLQFALDAWRNQENVLSDKSRTVGLTWLAVAFSVTLCLFNEGLHIGFGSRKEDYVDSIGNPGCIFYKARQFIKNLPLEFRGEWNEKKHSRHLLIKFPWTDCNMTGEAGYNIGRGNRYSLYFPDEAAWLEKPDLSDASLSEATNCRHDISTPHGMANSFARKRHGGKIKVFSFHWRDDPRRDEEWYRKKCEQLDDPVIIAQELDLDYSASLEGVVIPSKWVNAAIDAHIKLGIKPSGIRKIALDVADEGKDKNAVCGRQGILLDHIESWSGKGDDIHGAVERTFTIADVYNYEEGLFDADGIGAGVRAAARVINKHRAGIPFEFTPFHGSGAIRDPEGDVFPALNDEDYDRIKSRTNEDYFANFKAQSWWDLRKRFERTYRWVIEGVACDPELIISISSKAKEYLTLISELSQPTFKQSLNGKLMVNKTPDGARSPNHADAAMMCFADLHIRRGFFDV